MEIVTTKVQRKLHVLLWETMVPGFVLHAKEIYYYAKAYNNPQLSPNTTKFGQSRAWEVRVTQALYNSLLACRT